jgi:hypothetical protein
VVALGRYRMLGSHQQLSGVSIIVV